MVGRGWVIDVYHQEGPHAEDWPQAFEASVWSDAAPQGLWVLPLDRRGPRRFVRVRRYKQRWVVVKSAG